jgi:hypothetical protein
MLPHGVYSHVPPFENLVVQSYPQLQASLADHLHEQEFVSLLINILSNIARAHLCSCAGPKAGASLLKRLITPTFCLSLTYFFITLCTHLGLPHPIIGHLSWC